MRVERIATSVCQFVLFILTWVITFILALIIVPGIHESGHAGACLIEGGTVTQWYPLGFGTEPHTACSAKLDPFLAGDTAGHGTPVEFRGGALVLVVPSGFSASSLRTHSTPTQTCRSIMTRAISSA